MLPRFPEAWHYPSSANPERTYTLLNRESPEFVRFINPSDYRIAQEACGACHMEVIEASVRSLHSTGAMFWGGAAYNNGILDFKHYILGEAYDRNGKRDRAEGPEDSRSPGRRRRRSPASCRSSIRCRPGNRSSPATSSACSSAAAATSRNLFPETGLPNAAGQLQRIEEPGRPDFRQSNRGPGTGARIAVPVINITKTRLNDPLTWFIGTNDQPGDYRHSGCASCHVVYANDRDPRHSGVVREVRPRGHDADRRPDDQQDRVGPSAHAHAHALGADQPVHDLPHASAEHVPEQLPRLHDVGLRVRRAAHVAGEAAVSDARADPRGARPQSGRRGDARQVGGRRLPQAGVRAQSADEGHAVRRLPRPRLELPRRVQARPQGQPARRGRQQSSATTIRRSSRRPCTCRRSTSTSACNASTATSRRTITATATSTAKSPRRSRSTARTATALRRQLPNLYTSGPGGARRRHGPDDAAHAGRPAALRVGRRRALPALDDGPEPRMEDEPGQERGRPGEPRVQREGGARQADEPQHVDARVGQGRRGRQPGAHRREPRVLHLPHVVDDELRRLPSADRGELRRPSAITTKAARRATTRPTTRRSRATTCSCSAGASRRPAARSRRCARRSALVLSSTNSSRERIYIQQPPIAASGYSSQAFNPHYPHTERKTETKTCTDCHLSKDNDNNAIMAQLLAQGTNFVNFVGYNAYVGGDGEISGVTVTEWDEPQAVIGSYLHRYAYPDWFAQHEKNGRRAAARPIATTPATRAACSCAASICTSRKAAAACRSTTSRASATRACRSA